MKKGRLDNRLDDQADDRTDDQTDDQMDPLDAFAIGSERVHQGCRD